MVTNVRTWVRGTVAALLALQLGLVATPAVADDGIEPADVGTVEEVVQEPTDAISVQTEQLEAQGDSAGTAVAANDEEWATGTYTVTGAIENSNRITCSGNVVLVLNAGSKLTVPSGITVSEGNTLTIQGSGELVAGVANGTSEAQTEESLAGIGGCTEESAGNITISGGTVTATGINGGAGIGGGAYGDGGTVSISKDAVVKATGGGACEDATAAMGIGAGSGSSTHGTLAIGSGRVLYGSASDIDVDVNDEGLLRSGAVASYAGDRHQYMVVNGNKLAVSLSYATNSLTKSTDDAAFTNPLTNPSSVTVSYASSDTGVATVDSAGKVTLKGAGTATITASFAGDDAREAASASYVLTVKSAAVPTLTCIAHMQNAGDVTGTSGADSVVGTPGQGSRLEGMSLTLPEGTEGSVRYMVHSQGTGWSQGWVADGAYAGTRGEARRVEAIRVELAGGLEDDYDVWYRVHAKGYGWMGWAKNGGGAGITGQSRRIEAYEVVTLPTGSDAPGATDQPFEGLDCDEVLAASSDTVTADEGTYVEAFQIVILPQGSAAPGPTANAFVGKLTDDKIATSLSFAKAKVTKVYGAKAFTNRLANKSGVKVAYKSSNKKVAKVNKATGKVTIKGLGTATITAAFAGDDDHEAASASYRVVVRLAKTKGLKTVCHPSARTVDVSWNKVKGARKYQVQWRLRGGKWRTRATEGTSLTIKGMRAKGYYEIRVRAVSGKRRGAWSTTSRRWYVPTAGVSAKASKEKGKVKVSWSKTKGANKGYLVLVRYSEDGPIVAKKTVGKGQTSATISGLRSGKSAWVSVRPLRRAYGKTWIGVLKPITGVKIG